MTVMPQIILHIDYFSQALSFIEILHHIKISRQRTELGKGFQEYSHVQTAFLLD